MSRYLRIVPLALTLAMLALGGLTGCKSKEDKVCAHMKEMMDEAIAGLPEAAQEAARGSEEMANFDDRCMSEIAEIKEECTNADAVLDCALEADTMDAFENCEDVCQEGGGEGSR